MAALLHLFTYVAVIVAAVAIVAKAYKWASMPIHLRWELYPVPQEAEKAEHGGSFYEELDWWKKDRNASLVNEIMAMAIEALFIKALYENNRKLWYRSFPFHFGLYLLIGSVGLAVLASLMALVGFYPVLFGGILINLIKLTGFLGLVLSTIGAAALLHRRLTDEELIDYTAPRDIFNLVAFLVAFACAWISFAFSNEGTLSLNRYIYSIVSFKLSTPIGGFFVGLTLLLFSCLIMYVPLSHMSHFVGKYFMWHKVRWDDVPNLRGSDIEKKILTCVSYPVSWSARHLNADGKKNWLDIATEDLPQK